MVLCSWRSAVTAQSALDRLAVEKHSLVGSDEVQGTAVYCPTGDKIGNIKRVMIDTVSGRVVYAIVSFGGFLGIGEHHYPLPWNILTCNPGREGYEINIGEEELKSAPKCLAWDALDWNNMVQTINNYRSSLS
jgi:hypothetical protein